MGQSNNYDGKFGFALKNPSFSDRMLQIKVIKGPQLEKLKANFMDNIVKWFLGFYSRDQRVLPTEPKEQVLRTEEIHVNSAILASKSHFFHKLFSNGMQETDPRNNVTIKIDASEAVAFMELLHYMYEGKVSSSAEGSFVTLMDVMRLSDKFQVVSCNDYFIQLIKRTMTPESANVLVTGDILPLVEAAKEFLVTRYKDVMKFEKELYNLTLPAIEVIFSMEELQVPSEDLVYNMVVKWARKKYPLPQERRAVLGSCITRLVHFPCLSPGKLKDILARDDLDPDLANCVVKEALFFKAESSKEILDRRSIKRDYTSCIYYFDLSLDRCKRLKVNEFLYSGRFYLGNQSFCLSIYHFSTALGVYLEPKDSLLKEITVNYTFSAMKKPEMDFMKNNTTEHKFTSLSKWGYRNLFNMPWESFVAEDNSYFIDEMLHLKVEATIVE
ncbi:BTB/POZ domain-containing protein POB1 [Acorus calamus]|uniref:BTB/POZ domain-containing protein POB1 n=1 Tax=Acorus calamus TaxID=4465 RepID=A0AAV9F5R3_ACOCL|nr:BTB/POZ domain-containing protein POB1 [Acorus calamus]